MPKLTSLLVIIVCVWVCTAQAQNFDIVIRGGHIIDGTGSPWYAGDVGIRNGHIAAIGNLESAPTKRTINAKGMAVAPGFIDMLGQIGADDSRQPTPAFQDLPGHYY